MDEKEKEEQKKDLDGLVSYVTEQLIIRHQPIQDELIYDNIEKYYESVILSARMAVLLVLPISEFDTRYADMVSWDLRQIILEVSLGMVNNFRKEGIRSDAFEGAKTEYSSNHVQPFLTQLRRYAAEKGITSRTVAIY